MNALRSLILLLFFATSLYAQNFELSGKVVNDNGAPLYYVTILLYKAGEPNPVTGTATDESGNFKIQNLTGEPYSLVVSFIGYQPYIQLITLQSNLLLENIVLKEEVEILDETVIRVKRPTVVKEAGKLVFNVENTSLSSGNTYDLLAKTPGVLVLQDKISIKNGPTLVFINGRRVYLSASEVISLLKNVDASAIKAVEVITNPSAKYDAEAGAVLNIVTSRAISIGYKGSVNARYEQAVYPKYSLGTSHFYKNNWVNLYAGYSFNPQKEYKDQFDDIVFMENNGAVTSIWDTDFNRMTKSQVHQGNVIADFTLNDKNSVSFSSSVFVSPDKTFNNTVFAEMFNAQRQLDSTFRTTSELENDQHNLSFTGEYTTTLSEKGSSLAATANYILYGEEQIQNVATNYFLPNGDLIRNNSFFTNSSQDTKIFTGGLDLTVPFEQGAFEAGTKYSNIDTKSAIDFFNTQNNGMVFNPSLSDEFIYEESIYAAYLNFSKEWGNWETSLGLRTELTSVNGDSRSLGIVNTQESFELFPSINLQYKINNNNALGLSYARHIHRPRYQSLNPFKYFLNENNFNSGDPNLIPAIEDKITLSYNYKSKWFLEVYYQQTDDALSILRFQDNEAMIIRTEDANLIRDFQYSVDIIHVSSPTKWWYLSLYTSSFYLENKFFSVESPQETYSNSTYGFYGQLYNGLTFSKDQGFSGDITAVYISDLIYGSYDYGNQFSLSLSLRKTFWNNTASVSAGVNDIFDTNNVPVKSKYYNQNNTYFAQPETRLFRVSFKYTFGNANLRDNNRDNKPKETQRLEKNIP
jgi:hypothetical protein